MSWLDDAEGVVEHAEEEAAKVADSTNWKPAEGEILKGKLLNGAIVDGDYGPCKILNVETEDGSVVTVWAGNKLLADAVDQQAPAPGKGVVIKYGGMKKPSKPGGREYKLFTLACEESDFEYWLNIQKAFAAEASGPSSFDPVTLGGRNAGLESAWLHALGRTPARRVRLGAWLAIDSPREREAT